MMELELNEHAQRLNDTVIRLVGKVEALTAERDRLKERVFQLEGEQDQWQTDKQDAEAERDALAAQVAVLTTCLLLVKARHYGPLYDGADAAISACLDDIPSAAQRYLAADKAMQVHGSPADFADRLIAYRKACEGGGV